MAVNDPTMGVPTPTGVLEGAAAFSWDGASWQPAALAGPSVATPTGVLRGVAPFSWSGNAWTPAGRAGPGVSTPTGVLDGVALYTWSGSAWIPAGGGPGCPTPSGTLKGAAAFYWDGTAWQPAGQAAAEVPTPSGVLQGVAMFSWSGGAWVAASSLPPPGVALDANFMTPGTLPTGVTFTRGSTATYFDATGTMQTVSGNTPRWDYNPSTPGLNGLLIEEARTNLLLNSSTLGTQSVTTTATATTLSFYGTGSVTYSGAAAGTLNGTGATQRVSQTFTPTAGTLTCTVTGSVLNAQLEAGAFPTSYIPTSGAAVTRSQEQCSILSGNMGFYVSPGGSWAAEFIDLFNSGSNTAVICQHNGINNALPMYIDASAGYHLAQWDGGTPLDAANAVTFVAISKGATAYGSGTAKICLNAGSVVSATFATGYPLLVNGVDFLRTSEVSASQMKAGYLRRVRYWPRVLSNTEMQQVTT